jgi:23S rRNA pseudouridine1911/1915/1917 synthase
MEPEPQRFSFSCGAEEEGLRLDKFLSARLGDASRTRIQKWIEAGHAAVNGNPARKNEALRPGDTVHITVPPEAETARLEPEDIPLTIVYEDAFLAVVEKPKGMVTHPGHGVPSGTLANALAYRFRALSDLGGSDRPGIVHRLDRDTSGLLVVARDNATHAALAAQLAERKVRRTYRALCWREPAQAEGTFDWPLGRHPNDPVRRAVREDGKPASTHYRTLDWYRFAAHVEIALGTGRTHQIRVHFAHAGLPIAGDPVYGGREGIVARFPPLLQAPAAGLLKRLSSQALHAARLEFVHPREGKPLAFDSPLPAEFQNALAYLQAYRRADA